VILSGDSGSPGFGRAKLRHSLPLISTGLWCVGGGWCWSAGCEFKDHRPWAMMCSCRTGWGKGGGGQVRRVVQAGQSMPARGGRGIDATAGAVGGALGPPARMQTSGQPWGILEALRAASCHWGMSIVLGSLHEVAVCAGGEHGAELPARQVFLEGWSECSHEQRVVERVRPLR
jgi:hypothetical protein